jgi:hypothetical protein
VAVGAYLRGFPDDDAHSMIDEQTVPDLRARVDFNPRKEARNMRD